MKTLEAGLMKNWTSKHRESSANNSIVAKGTQCVGMSDGGAHVCTASATADFAVADGKAVRCSAHW